MVSRTAFTVLPVYSSYSGESHVSLSWSYSDQPTSDALSIQVTHRWPE